MENLKYTKGQWEVTKKKDGQTFYNVCAIDDKKSESGQRLVLATCHYEEAWKDSIISDMGRKESEVRRTKEEAEANAKLIADSPIMLSLLKQAHHVLKTYVIGGNSEFEFEHDLVDEIDAIISKHNY